MLFVDVEFLPCCQFSILSMLSMLLLLPPPLTLPPFEAPFDLTHTPRALSATLTLLLVHTLCPPFDGVDGCS